MSFSKSTPVQINQPDPNSGAIADRLHIAVIRGKIGDIAKILDCGVSVELANRSGQTPLFCAAFLGHLDVVKLLLKQGADPNRRCSVFCCTPVHAACWSGNKQLISSLLVAGGDLRFHDQHNRSPRDWALLQADNERRMASLSMIELFRQMAIKGCDMKTTEGVLDVSTRSHSMFKLPAKLRNMLAALGLACSENCDYIGPLGNVQGTGFGKVLYGHGESAAAFWPVPLVSESQLSDPDDDYCDVKAALNGLMQKGVAFRVGPTTEMVPRRWHQTPQHHHNISIRRLKNNHPPDILFEELHNMSRLRHPGLLLLMGVSATQHWESIQLIYEPVYQGSLHYRLHVMGSSIPLLKRLIILQQICDALLFLHCKNLLHCSITSHAVHLISTSQAKLGCLETLSDDSTATRVFRKVPAIHWDWCMAWIAPECARGEGICTLSDVYSFCCLVWETCTETIPWHPMTSKEISEMWLKKTNRMLNPNEAIPTHIASFLNLGLQPKLEERQEIDLQEIYLMLRLQAAALARSQHKDPPPKNAAADILVAKPGDILPTRPAEMLAKPSEIVSKPTGNILPKHVTIPECNHSWDAVKERMKNKTDQQHQVQHDDDPDESDNETAYTDFSQPVFQVNNEDQYQEQETARCLDEDTIGLSAMSGDFAPVQLPKDSVYRATCAYPYVGHCNRMNGHHAEVVTRECAIKPASHNTERHTSTCFLSCTKKKSAGVNNSIFQTPKEDLPKNLKVYSSFNCEIRQAVAHPKKLYYQLTDFEAWHSQVDIDDDEQVETTEQVTSTEHQAVGQPTFSSTPKQPELLMEPSFLACSSRLEETTGAKPKKCLKYPPTEPPPPPPIPQRIFANKPTTEFVATLTAIFNAKRIDAACNQSQVNIDKLPVLHEDVSPNETTLVADGVNGHLTQRSH